MSYLEIEERVVAVVARFAGVSVAHITPDLPLRELGCRDDQALDLIEVLEDEIGVSSAVCQASHVGTPLDTVWDVVMLFHRAQHRAPKMRIRVGKLMLEF